MDEIRQQQIEAIRDVVEYSKRLRTGIQRVTEELRGDKLEDTELFLEQVITGINWVVEVVNVVMSVLNEKEKYIQKEQINKSIFALSDALKEKDDKQMAEILETGIISFLDTVEAAANTVE